MTPNSKATIVKGKELYNLAPGRNRSQPLGFPIFRTIVNEVKCSSRTDPLVHHGRHFGRTVHALCSVHSLLINGMSKSKELAARPETTLIHKYTLLPAPTTLRLTGSRRDKMEHEVFEALLRMIPTLEERLETASDEEIERLAELVGNILLARLLTSNGPKIQKGVSGARSDDTKSLKGTILDWITPPGEALNPPLARNVKCDRGYHHERTGALLCPTGLDWSCAE
jgi:hypothetical protein